MFSAHFAKGSTGNKNTRHKIPEEEQSWHSHSLSTQQWKWRNYGPKLALQAIRKKAQSDYSIKLIFITGDGNKSALGEIFEVDEKMAHRWLHRVKRKRKQRSKVRKNRQHLAHAAALLNV